MGNFFQSKKKAKLLFVGLDNSGKTSIVKRLQQKKGDVVPTIGSNSQAVEGEIFDFDVIDMSGQSKYRSQWQKFSDSADAIVFVIDSSDRFRLKVAAEELKFIINSQKRIPILFFFNKMDLKEAADVSEIIAALELKRCQNKFTVQPSCALDGRGLKEGFSWLQQQLKKNDK